MTTIRGSLRRWFLLIQEPRVIRISMFFVYLWTIYTGYVFLTQSPDQFFDATGPRIVYTIAVGLIVGGVCGLIAILPGTWWLERAGIIAISTGLVARGILILALDGSAGAFCILVLTMLLFVIRWMTIRKADLAPIAS